MNILCLDKKINNHNFVSPWEMAQHHGNVHFDKIAVKVHPEICNHPSSLLESSKCHADGQTRWCKWHSTCTVSCYKLLKDWLQKLMSHNYACTPACLSVMNILYTSVSQTDSLLLPGLVSLLHGFKRVKFPGWADFFFPCW